MTFLQKLLVTWLPSRWAQAIQAESQSWLLRCPACGTTRSVWDVGGIRFKAASRSKRLYLRCAHCHSWRWMPMEHKPISEQIPAQPESFVRS